MATRRRHDEFDAGQLKSRFAVGAALAVGMAAWFLTPLSDWVADAVVYTIPVQQDIALGRAAVAQAGYRLALEDFGIPDLGRQLVASNSELQRSGFHWSFQVIQANYVNAFAYPGGYIFVTDQLVRQLQASQSEIAAVLAHEIGHVVNRHSQKRLIKDKVFQFLLKVLFYDDKDDHRESFGEAAGELLVKSAKTLGSMGFSRANEYEADATGWSLCRKAGLDPRGFKSFFLKLLALEGGSGATRWESTHPGTKDRIQALQQKWDALPAGEKRRYGGEGRGAYDRYQAQPDWQAQPSSMAGGQGQWQEPERRIARDGRAYTRQEFMNYYGGTRQWDEATPIDSSRWR